jgi:hypothetical protein
MQPREELHAGGAVREALERLEALRQEVVEAEYEASEGDMSHAPMTREAPPPRHMG